LCYGIAAFRKFSFPLLFLLLMIPVPEPVLNRIVALLQWGSADVAHWMLKVAEVPVLRHGVVLSLPGIDIEVATECIGIRSSLMLLMVTLVLGHLFLQSLWRQFFLVLAVFPVTVLKNGLRIFTLSALAVYDSPAVLDSWFHHSGGVFFFAAGLGILI